ncbi:hypothetical protein BKA70DRAFT_778340 [Coprinopsis sp. MPI-PUGE-AT-0042]|nr:hypothetical protein BKA70DRAFT_778340 [Coprinopsis sp. MPI-PUGE-AT-0042]
MATKPYSNSPWPSPTPDAHPPPPSSHAEGRSLKRRRMGSGSWAEAREVGERSIAARQTVPDQDRIEQARRDCQIFSGNEVISCFPTAGWSIPQHQWATFVWNSRRPELVQINRVDIYLFRADSREQVLVMRDQPNPTNQAGVVTAVVDDRWFGSQGESWDGGRVSYPFYWVIQRSDRELNGDELPQSTFSAVQTTYLDSVAASMSSSSAAAASSSSARAASLSSASQASLASLSLASLSSTRVTTINGTPTTLTGTAAFPSGNVQAESGDNSFPRWAIAVIVVLGFLAIAATCILAFLILRRVRRRKQARLNAHRDSMGSSSPMMANAANQQQSPVTATGVLPSIQRPDSLRRNDSYGGQAPSVLHDGASGVSGEGGPFSGADAAIMADAFRKMLRKPEFPAVEEGESPDSKDDQVGPMGGSMLTRELAEEGKEVRSVSSSRGVKVESHDESHEPRDPRTS